ncbi:MAG: hypothetical protein GXP29_15155, partial [Planctomycetes bacterium]|nr:hypothetical protein [Planctomycetota bacterium]
GAGGGSEKLKSCHYAPSNNNECKDPVRWTIIETDLDADSNNDGTIDPDNSSMGTDDPIEAEMNLAGQIIFINSFSLTTMGTTLPISTKRNRPRAMTI